jgi:glycosyltransferase involved in cell wall biosynthesis
MMDSVSPTVTVIIATYNKSSVLRYAIDSVLWQTFRDFELWVIGDGCTDDSEAVVGAYDDPRVHWFNLPENTGYQSEPHNEGLRRARGKYIAYLNHDDIWLPNHLQVLVDCIEENEADFAYSIMEWILYWADPYPDIPQYPDPARPPEATATLHRRDIVDEIGYWKPPTETYAVPRAEYFRRAQFIGKRFAFAPALTALKFGGSKDGYAGLNQQPEFMAKIRDDPDFVHKELAGMLARAYHELETPITLKRLRYQVLQSIRRKLVKQRIDPARMRFWTHPGKHIRDWRKSHGLDPL